MSAVAESGLAPAAAGTTVSRWPTLRWSSIALACGVLVYRLLLDFGYRATVAAYFGYQGFQNAPTVSRLLLSWLLLLTLLPVMVRLLRTETLSAQITSLLALISVVWVSTFVFAAAKIRSPAMRRELARV